MAKGESNETPPNRPAHIPPADLRQEFAKTSDREDLAGLLGFSLKLLTFVAYRLPIEQKYKQFRIPKRSGGVRELVSPHGPLRAIQDKLKKLLDALYDPRPGCFGFVRGKSIISNASPHVAKRWVLTIDLSNFFTSIHFGRVRGALMARPIRAAEPVATLVAQLACYNGYLPQGAPTSPVISNIVCARLDADLRKLARRYRLDYSRYADDITFSFNGNRFPDAMAHLDLEDRVVIGASLADAISGNGFLLNSEKTRLSRSGSRQRVTGLIVNARVNVRRSFIRDVRATLHAWRKYDESIAASVISRRTGKSVTSASLPSVVHGKLEFIRNVRGPSDPVFLKLASEFNNLASKGMFPLHDAIERNEQVRRAVWVLECEKDIRQGTTFKIADIGFVTCAHVIGRATHAFHPSNPRRVPIKVSLISERLDLAVIIFDESPCPSNGLLLSDRTVNELDQVLVVGYPKFRLGDTLQWRPTFAAGRRTQSMVERITLGPAVVSGCSGGPVLDSKMGVIGVAVTGADNDQDAHETDLHAAIPSSAILDLVAQP